MIATMNPVVRDLVNQYPEEVRLKFLEIRSLIYSIAEDSSLGEIEETLKWGQPAYLCKTGSTIRVDWSLKDAKHVEVLFNCKTILVETFKEVFRDSLSYKGNRIVIVAIDQPVPLDLEASLLMALNYHHLKKRPLLGA